MGYHHSAGSMAIARLWETYLFQRKLSLPEGCTQSDKRDIKEAIADGADSFKKVKKKTGASLKCGHCECRVKKYAKKQLKKHA